MKVIALRGRAALWTLITVVAVSVPWSRTDCGVGSVPVALLVACAALVGAAAGVAALRRSYGWRRQDPLAELPRYWTLIAVAATGEELLFRGVLLRAGADWWGIGPAIAVSSAVFGLAHWSRAKPAAAVVHVFTGAIFGATAWLAGGWLASASLHVVYNCVAFEWRPTGNGRRRVAPVAVQMQ